MIADQRKLSAALLLSGPTCDNLTLAEAALARDADDEAFATSWVVHVGVVVVTAATVLVLGLAYDGLVDPDHGRCGPGARRGPNLFAPARRHSTRSAATWPATWAGPLHRPRKSPAAVVPFIGHDTFGAMLTLSE